MLVYLDHNASSPMQSKGPGNLGLGLVAKLARLEIERLRHHLQQLRDACEDNLRDVDRLASGSRHPVDNLPAAIRRAAV